MVLLVHTLLKTSTTFDIVLVFNVKRLYANIRCGETGSRRTDSHAVSDNITRF